MEWNCEMEDRMERRMLKLQLTCVANWHCAIFRSYRSYAVSLQSEQVSIAHMLLYSYKHGTVDSSSSSNSYLMAASLGKPELWS